MKCSKCNYNDANVYIEQTVNGETRKAHLCSECAHSSGMYMGFQITPGGLDFSQAPQSMHNFWFAPDKSSASQTPACSVCGHLFSSFKKSSKLGCAACYEAFEAELVGIFGKLQPGTRHIGKIPTRKSEAIQKGNQLADLKSKLQAAISNEEYEEAAKIRDIIREMEGK